MMIKRIGQAGNRSSDRACPSGSGARWRVSGCSWWVGLGAGRGIDRGWITIRCRVGWDALGSWAVVMRAGTSAGTVEDAGAMLATVLPCSSAMCGNGEPGFLVLQGAALISKERAGLVFTLVTITSWYQLFTVPMSVAVEHLC